MLFDQNAERTLVTFHETTYLAVNDRVLAF